MCVTILHDLGYDLIEGFQGSRTSKLVYSFNCLGEHFTLLVEDIVSPSPVLRTTMRHTATCWTAEHTTKQFVQRINSAPRAHEP